MSNTPAMILGRPALSKKVLDFAPGLLAIQEEPPSRMPRVKGVGVEAGIAKVRPVFKGRELDGCGVLEGVLPKANR